MASALNGYILVYRKIQEHWLWDNTEPFDKAHAWIDLIFTARWREKDVFFGGSLVTVKRGQMVTSIRHLSERWNWSRTKVTAFLDALETDQMIVRKSDTKKTLVTIVNYELYQDLVLTEEPPKSRQNDTKKPQKSHQKDRMNKRNKSNKGKEEREINKEKEVDPQTDLPETRSSNPWWDDLTENDETPEEWRQDQ